MLRGISIREDIGIGDKIQFTSLPENYFRKTGDKMVDVSKAWVFDHNPYVLRDVKPDRTQELWNFPKRYEYPLPTRCNGDHTIAKVYTSNAEIWAGLYGIPVVLNRPRLYIYEDLDFVWRRDILYHHSGKSHGTLPNHVSEHVINKYGKTNHLFQIGKEQPRLLHPNGERVTHAVTPTIWALVEWISRCRMLISVDSGPCWIGACYPDVIVKKIRNMSAHGTRMYHDWVPMEITNIHAHWDDPLFLHYQSLWEDDVGPFQSWKKL